LIERFVVVHPGSVFSARQHRAICYRPSVRLSVRPSHGWIIQKRLKLGSWSFHCIYGSPISLVFAG